MSNLLAAMLLGASLAPQDPGTSYRFRIPGPVTPAAAAMLAARFDRLGPDRPDAGLDLIVLPEQLAEFRASAPQAVLVDRGRPYHEIRAAQPAAPDPAYYTYAELIAEIDALVAAHPTLARKVDLSALPGASRTHENRPIWALLVSDHAAVDEDEPAILIAAQHHARELNTAHIVVGAMRRVLAGQATDPVLQRLVADHELWFVPCANPDGTEYVWNTDNYWRKNRRPNGGGVYGVDQNRNYEFLWGLCGSSTLPSSQTYRGPSAASEPETRTLVALVRATRPEQYLDFHSSGREVLFPYAPCATVGASVRSLLQGYADRLRQPMAYATRAPSGSGEAPEAHWARSGALSFLTEISDQFQPPFAQTITEEARVWPGLLGAMRDFRPAVRGHVRSVHQAQPIEAELRVDTLPFQHGERTWSRARDGRFALWLPAGTHRVTVSAAGFQPIARDVVVTVLDQPQTLELELEPAWPPATLALAGTHRLGTTSSLTYSSPGDAGALFWITLSTGTDPGLPIGGRVIPLNPDLLFLACATPDAILRGNLGTLGTVPVVATLPIPVLPGLAGLRLHAGGITLADGYTAAVKKFSPAASFTLQP
jgi:hypothetical protein